MITGGKSHGTGKYSYHERSSGYRSVMVAHMPEDSCVIRVVCRSHGEAEVNMKLSETHAELLWASLCDMAKDLKWKDFGDDTP